MKAKELKSVVLISGGLDSAVNLFKSKSEGEVLLGLTFNYGQRAAAQEIQSANKLCHHLGVPHKTVDVPWIKEFGKSSLTDHTKVIPTQNEVQIDNYNQSLKTAASVWVPNRNGILLNIAAGFAESLGADCVVPGFNLEEAQTFPDNSEDYLKALSISFSFSTANKVQAFSFTTKLNKIDIVKLGLELQLPFELIWPCYFAGEKWCGECESCLRFKRALMGNSILEKYKTIFI